METIVFKNVKKSFGDFTLDIPKLAIKKGYITGFIGENGAGKTTTIKLILNMIIADQGKIEVDGLEVNKYSSEIKQKIGYVGERTGYPQESTLNNIKRMIAPFYENWDEKLFEKYIQDFELSLGRKYGDLSTGQKQQFALVMALSHKPELIILDEPTAGLDPVVRNKMLDVLMAHMQDESVTIFYSTHITSDLEKAGDYLVYIKKGKIIMTIEKDELLNSYCIVKGPKHLFTEETKEAMLGYRKTSLGGEGLVKSKKLAEEFFGNEVKYIKPTIEDIMVLLSESKGE